MARSDADKIVNALATGQRLQTTRYEIHYETGDSWWWQATENTRVAAEQRVEELRRRFPTREWRIQELTDEE